jgi:hypothetical protein
MKAVLSVLSGGLVLSFAVWAYGTNYDTRAALDRVATLEAEIGAEREALSVLRAEWAWLNRPERLRDLAERNFAALQLMPMDAAHFGDPASVAYPQPSMEDLIAEALGAVVAEPAVAAVPASAGAGEPLALVLD